MATLADNLAKSGGRMLETPNSWKPGSDNVAEATWLDWLAQEEDRLQPDAARILYDARMAPPDTRLEDPDSLRSALEFVYGDCDWKKPTRNAAGDPDLDAPPDVAPIMARIYRPSARPDESKRRYLNWPTAPLDAWTTSEDWARLADPSITVDAGDRVVLFFDGSKSRDASALIGCRVEDGHVFTLGVWEPDPYDPADTVDAGAVDLTVAQAFGMYDVAAFYSDVREWESYALTEWPTRYGDDLDVWSAPNARPPAAIAWDMRGHSYEFAKAAEAVEAELHDPDHTRRPFTHDGDTRVARHVANARRRHYRDAVTIGKESRDSPLKVDAAVAMIGARMLRRIVLTTPSRRKPARSGVVW